MIEVAAVSGMVYPHSMRPGGREQEVRRPWKTDLPGTGHRRWLECRGALSRMVARRQEFGYGRGDSERPKGRNE